MGGGGFSDLGGFKKLDGVASGQPSHATYDFQAQNYNEERLGKKRARYTFAWRSLEKKGAPLAFGTDWPVMPLNPAWGLFAAVTRQNTDGLPREGWISQERISMANAIRHYTYGSAYAISRESELGRLVPGMLADLAVMGEDLFRVQGSEILKVSVKMTWFDGKLVYQKQEGAN